MYFLHQPKNLHSQHQHKRLDKKCHLNSRRGPRPVFPISISLFVWLCSRVFLWFFLESSTHSYNEYYVCPACSEVKKWQMIPLCIVLFTSTVSLSKPIFTLVVMVVSRTLASSGLNIFRKSFMYFYLNIDVQWYDYLIFLSKKNVISPIMFISNLLLIKPANSLHSES